MLLRKTPSGPWVECSADFKGPIAGRYYFHVDNYSRWPEVEVLNSTEFTNLRPALDRSFGILGIPSSITHDNGPPYHAAIAEGKDPKVEVRQRVMNYPNTPHPSTEKASSELIIGPLLKTKIPMIAKPPNDRVHREAKAQDKMTQEK